MESIFSGYFGSTLYGLTTPNSDIDKKAIYAPNPMQLATGSYRDVIEAKDIDYTQYSVQKFLKMLSKSDSVSMDMIHTPKCMTLQSSDLWEQIKSCKQDLYSKQATGILGYIKTQASKYGHKVQRLEEIRELIDYLDSVDLTCKVEDTLTCRFVKAKVFKFITVNEKKGDVLQNIDVCGSRMQTNATVEHFLNQLRNKERKYGERTNKGTLEGGDWKALSHAYRVLCQFEEIVDTRNLIFPLVKASDIMEMKLGKISQDTAISKINTKYDVLIEKLNNSDLQDEPNTGNIKAYIMNHYF